MSLSSSRHSGMPDHRVGGNPEQLITDNLGIWTAAIKNKATTGRGSNKKQELYGIKKLRELILELAVRGLLVPQDPNDEPANVLLEKIASEKEQLIEDGKVKQTENLPPIGEDEKLFRSPNGWEWARVGDLFRVVYGKGLPNSKLMETGYDVFGANGIIGKYEKYLYEDEQLLVSCRGAYSGKPNISPSQCYVTSNSLVLEYSWKYLSLRYFYYSLTSADKSAIVTGSAQPQVTATNLNPFVVLVPPLAEQSRIVAKVDELMDLCDQLEQQTETSLNAHQTLVETLLKALLDAAQSRNDGSSKESAFEQAWQRIADHFDVLFTTEHSIELLKQTILQLAVMGKLVPQDPNDESASALFARLETERDSFLTERSSDDNEAKTMLRKLKKLDSPKEPFPLPDSWSCIHLIQLCSSLVDCHNKTAPYVESGIPIIRTTNIRERQFVARDLKYVNQETYDYWSRRCPPKPGDIMFTREAPMGEALIIPEGETWCLGQRTMLIRVMHEFVSNEYLLLALTEPHLLERASEHAVGLTVKHLRVGDVENLNVPLPPLNEQKRIVEKVNALMSLCDSLKVGIRESQTTQLHLADAMAEQVLQ